jgi:antitoxin component YwqK of YwqJK toxin-antitoxin module
MKTLYTILFASACSLLSAGNGNNSTYFRIAEDAKYETFVSAAGDTNRFNASGQREGFWLEKNAGYEWSGYYVNGQKHGTFVGYPLGIGLLSFIETYDMGKKNGLFLVADRAGYITKEEFYRNDSLEGFRRTYYTGGRLKTEEQFKGGKLHGVKKVWNSQNRIVEEGHFVNGQRHGINKWFYSSGKLNTESNYVNGSLEGPMTTYYENGNIYSKTVYKNNEIEGEYIEFHENGKVKVKGFYVKGKEEGKWNEFYESGAPYLQGQFKNGLREGSWTEMSEAGKKTATVKYKAGVIISGTFTGAHPNPKTEEVKPAQQPQVPAGHNEHDGHNH